MSYQNKYVYDFNDNGLPTNGETIIGGGADGIPTAPTPSNDNNTNQIATTAFVKNIVSDVVGNAGSSLDTLGKIASAIGNDPNFSNTVNNSIALKANVTDLNSGLALKANVTDLNSGLALKANVTDLNSGLALKANITDVNSSLALKANVTDLNSGLALKANITDVNSGLALKANVTDVNSSLALKAPLASPALTGVPTAPTAINSTNTTQIATTAFVKSVVADVIGTAGAALDTLGEIATALGNDANLSTTLTNSISTKAPIASPTFTGTVTAPTLAVTGNETIVGNLDVSGNMTIAGTIIQNYRAYPAINPAADWEGVWAMGLISPTTTDGYIAFVKQPNNTYTLYTNQIDAGDGLKDQNWYARTERYMLLATNVVPTLTFDSSGNITENSITIPTSYSGRASYPGVNKKLHRRLLPSEIGSDYCWYKSSTSTTSYPGPSKRFMKPTDVTPVSGGDWFSAYQTIYNEKLQKRKTQIDVFDDIEGTYDDMVKDMFVSRYVSNYFVDIITGEKKPSNKYSPSGFNLMNKADKLKYATDNFVFDVNRVHQAILAKKNVFTFHYDWKLYNLGTPLVSPYNEIQIINKLSPDSSVIGTIPSSFKFLPSMMERNSIKQNWCGIKEPNEWFMDNYIGLRLPLVISGAKTINITTTLTRTGNNVDIIPGTYTVTIPDNWVGYPHDLATYVTQKLNPNSGLRLQFYTSTKDGTNPTNYTNSSFTSFYYLSSGNYQLDSVSVSCNDSSFLSNILGLNTLTAVQNPNPVTAVVEFIACMVPRGGFSKYTYNGSALDINKLFTPQTIPSATNLQLKCSIGNVLGSGNPRDYYNVMFYFMQLAKQEEHTGWSYIVTSQDIDEEIYMPNTWEEAQYNYVDFNVPHIVYGIVFPQGHSNTNFRGIGTQGKALVGCGTSLANDGGPAYYGTGVYTAKHALITESGVSISKYLKPNMCANLLSNTLGYTVTNYLDSSNTFVSGYRFTSTTTNLLSQDMGTYWMPKYSAGTLPSDVSVTSSQFLISNLLAETSNLRYGTDWTYGSFYGIMKQNVANNILPIDASGSVVGVVCYNSSFCNTTNTKQLRNGIVNLFNSKGVKYVVVDRRNDLGGTASATDSVPFGLDASGSIYQSVPTNLLIPIRDGLANEIEYGTSARNIIVDILNNPQNWPSTYRYTLDSSGIIVIPASGGLQNDIYKQTGVTGDLYAVSPNSNLTQPIVTVDGNLNGKGILSCTFLMGTNTNSQPKSHMYNIKRHCDINDYNGYASKTPNAPNTNTKTRFTFYGVNNRLFAAGNAFGQNVFDYVSNNNPSVNGSLPNNPFLNIDMICNTFPSNDYYNNWIMSSFNLPLITMDALANYTPATFMLEVGVYYDSSGEQQAYTGANKNAFYVSNDNPLSYRDFRLERAVQVAYAQRANARSQTKFGYMPIDTSSTYPIIDPYNWNITDTSGALSLPANPFGL